MSTVEPCLGSSEEDAWITIAGQHAITLTQVPHCVDRSSLRGKEQSMNRPWLYALTGGEGSTLEKMDGMGTLTQSEVR